MISSQPWIVPDLYDERLFSIQVNEDATLIGFHTLSVKVSSVDYPSISAYTIDVFIDVYDKESLAKNKCAT